MMFVVMNESRVSGSEVSNRTEGCRYLSGGEAMSLSGKSTDE